MKQPLTLAQVRQVAKLSRLALSAEEEQQALGQLQQILEAVATLEQLDTADVAATSQVNAPGGGLRADLVEPALGVEQALANAPARVGSHFAVPKILD